MVKYYRGYLKKKKKIIEPFMSEEPTIIGDVFLVGLFLWLELLSAPWTC